MRPRLFAAILLAGLAAAASASADAVRLKDLGRFLGWRDNALIGYGLVTGLTGSGDSPHSAMTQRALSNVLNRLGSSVPPEALQSRNIAAVLVTATLPPSANVGDRIDVAVSSAGDARSLVGGTLLMTPLMGPDQRVYALAQGPLVVGGYRFDSSVNREQKNYPTSGTMPGGATVEHAVRADLLDAEGQLTFVLNSPDFTTAQRIRDGVAGLLGPGAAVVASASSVRIRPGARGGDVNELVSRLEGVAVSPDAGAVVVVNERTGTVVAGGGVQISSVVVSQGDIRVSVSLDDRSAVDPPAFSLRDGGGGRSLVVTNTRLQVTEPREDAMVRFPNTTVADLVSGLERVHINTRGMIAVLQAIKAAGALHAEIIVQ